MSQTLIVRNRKTGATSYFSLGPADGFEYEIRDDRKCVLVQILTRPGQAVFPKSILTYEDTTGKLVVGDYVTVPVGTKRCVGEVVEFGRGGWDGYVRAVIGRLSLDPVTLPF